MILLSVKYYWTVPQYWLLSLQSSLFDCFFLSQTCQTCQTVFLSGSPDPFARVRPLQLMSDWCYHSTTVIVSPSDSSDGHCLATLISVPWLSDCVFPLPDSYNSPFDTPDPLSSPSDPCTTTVPHLNFCLLAKLQRSEGELKQNPGTPGDHNQPG